MKALRFEVLVLIPRARKLHSVHYCTLLYSVFPVNPLVNPHFQGSVHSGMKRGMACPSLLVSSTIV